MLGEDGPLTQQALCARMVMDKVTVSRTAAALNERGLTSRAPNASDGRSHRLSLTVEGATLYAEIAPSALAYEALLLESFGPSERKSIDALLRRLEAAATALTASE